MAFTNMNVGMVRFDNWGEDSDEKSNWSLLDKHVTFKHSEDCMFIIYCKQIGPEELKLWSDIGYSQDLIALICLAHCSGYDWVCLHN